MSRFDCGGGNAKILSVDFNMSDKKRMIRYRLAIFPLFVVSCMLSFFGTPSNASAQSTCTQTLSVGANIASAVSNAANGSVICLNSGSYGSVNLFDISRSGYVTVQSTTNKDASISPQVGNTDYVRFESLTISGFVLQNSCSTHVQWVNNNFSGQGLTLSNDGCGDLDTTIDGNSFTAFDVDGGYEGRVSLVYGSGITLTNNFFGDGGASDGVQLLGNVSNVNVGPGNTFSGILESLCGDVHCDAIQLYGAGSGIIIEKNLFENGDTFIMAPDGSSGVTVRNNIFDGNGVSYSDKIQFGTASSPIFEHNTLRNIRASFDSKTENPASTNVIARNNILIDGSLWKTAGGNGCSSCSFTYNLFDSSSNASGTNNVIGTPIFAGGSNPNWSGWQLASGSPGKNAGNDGLDMGTLYYGIPDTTPPTSPTNLSATSTSQSSITVSWTASADDTGVAQYQVERCTGLSCSSFTQVGTPTASPFVDTGLTPNTVYNYHVRATDAAGNLSGWSNVVGATTQASDTTPPTAPTSLSATATSSSTIDLTWTASTDNVGVTSYQVERCQGSGCTNFSQITNQPSTNYQDTGLSASTLYRYQVRAVDGAGNNSSFSNIASAMTPALPATITLWPASTIPLVAADSDSSSVELGVKFTSDIAGSVLGIRFYKGPGNTGTHTGSLWTTSGTRLATVTFTGETASGWQQMLFSTPVSTTPGTTYIASYYAPSGHYANNANYFSSAYDNAPLHAPSSPSSGGNGVYLYGSGGGFPNQNYQATNYWVDIVFAPQQAQSQSCNTITTGNFSQSAYNSYGAPFDAFQTSTNLLDAKCTSSDTHTINLTTGITRDTTRIVYTKGYWYDPVTTSWTQYSGTCTGALNGEWCQGSVSATITSPNLSTASATNPAYLVGMTCSVQGGSWKCGCRDTTCANFYWQVQGAGM